MSTDPLKEWSRVANENTIHSVVSVAYAGMLSKSPQIDTFSTWLLAGTGATASLLIANIELVSKALSIEGFQISLSVLSLSALFGLFTKCASLFFPIDNEAQDSVKNKMIEILVNHGETRKKIEESAALSKVAAPPDLELKALIDEILKPMPFWAKWFVGLYFNKHKDNRQIAYLLPLRAFMWQTNLCSLQALFFIGFIVLATIYAGSV